MSQEEKVYVQLLYCGSVTFLTVAAVVVVLENQGQPEI